MYYLHFETQLADSDKFMDFLYHNIGFLGEDTVLYFSSQGCQHFIVTGDGFTVHSDGSVKNSLKKNSSKFRLSYKKVQKVIFQ